MVAPEVDDADRDVDLGMDDALLGEVLHHAPGGQLVVVGGDEQPGDGLEGVKEAGEIGEAVEGFGFREGERGGVVAGAELDQGGGKDGAFEMKVQLGLGEAADEGGELSIGGGHCFHFPLHGLDGGGDIRLQKGARPKCLPARSKVTVRLPFSEEPGCMFWPMARRVWSSLMPGLTWWASMAAQVSLDQLS